MKKGTVTDFLPYLILGLIGIIVISAALIIPGLIAARESGEAGICGLHMMYKGIAHKVTLGKVKAQDLPDACRVKDVFIDEKMVEEHLDEAEKAIKKYKKDPQKYKEVLRFFDEDETSYWEWALDKILADELFNCWAFKANFGAVDTTFFLATSHDCLWCSKIGFSKDLQEHIKPKKYFIKGWPYIGSLGPFMRVEEKGYKFKTKQTLMTYDQWINNNYQFYPLREIPYNIYLVDSKDNPIPWAIVYVMTSDKVALVAIPGTLVQRTWMAFLPAVENIEDPKSKLRRELYWYGSTLGEHEACEVVFGE